MLPRTPRIEPPRTLRVLPAAVALLGLTLTGEGHPSSSQPLRKAPGHSDAIEHFELRIRPVLVERCYRCHNSVDRAEAGLALDHAAGWRAGGRSGPVIVPGDPEGSLLLRTLQHDRGVEGMPLDEPRLEPNEVESFRDWIAAGALDPRSEVPTAETYAAETSWEATRERRARWWSFLPLSDPEPPQVQDGAWPRDPLDRFVLASLESEGRPPRPDQSRRDWLRRASHVLTGLPPTPEELDAFAATQGEAPFEAAVDRLLRDPASSERLAQHWMDLWRYAESHGSEGDPTIAHAFRYRDALVRSFDADVPWDQLLVEHVAGDLVEPRLSPDGTLNEAATLTAHYRFPTYGYAPTDALAEQIRTVDNQIDVLTKASMGLTVSCARCHDHKFDPISQADWTALHSTLLGARAATTVIDAPDHATRSLADLEALRPRLQTALAQDWHRSLTDLSERLLAPSPDLAKRLEQAARAEPSNPLRLLGKGLREPHRIPEFLEAALVEVEAGRRRLAARAAEAGAGSWHLGTGGLEGWAASGTSLTRAASPPGAFAILPEGPRALEALLPAGVYSHLLSDKHAAHLSSPWLTLEEGTVWVRLMGGDGARARYVPRGYPRVAGPIYKSQDANARTPAWRRFDTDFWAGDRAYLEVATARDLVVEVRGQERSRFGLSEVVQLPPGTEPPREELAENVASLLDADGIPQDAAGLAVRYERAALEALESWRTNTASDAEVRFLDALLAGGLLSAELEALPRAAPLVEQWRTFEAAIPVPTRAPGVQVGEPVVQRLMHRGVPTDLREEVRPRFLEVFGGAPFPDGVEPRLALAQALVAPSNPLTPRTAVNRLWTWVFGTGLVPTTENLGLLAPEPERPDLLEHLASSFVASGWDTRALLRRLVLSRTFRQQGPPRRRDAEALRDALLQASGQLDPTRLGPSVSEESPRRSLYVAQRRGNPPAFLRTFGQPDGATTQGTRAETNVPAQALALLNGPLARNAAVGLARRALAEATAERSPVDRMWSHALGRLPTDEETQAATDFVAELGAARAAARKALTTALADEARASARAEGLLARGREWVRVARGQGEAKGVELPLPLAAWELDGDLRDRFGALDGELIGAGHFEDGTLVLEGGWVLTPPLTEDLGARTLEARVRLENREQRGAGILGVQTLQGGVFDTIVFNERRPGEWLAGSDFFRRTEDLGGAPESSDGFVVLTITYALDGTITAYRDGVPYGHPIRKSERVPYPSGQAQFLLGGRHGDRTRMAGALRGALDWARVYSRALTPLEVAASASGDADFVSRDDALAALQPSELEQLATHEAEARAARQRARDLEPLTTGPDHQPWIELAAALFLLEEFRYLP